MVKGPRSPEVVTGDQLYNDVVEDEHMGRDLLECGGIKKLLTTDVDPQKHEVQPTLSIVGYPDEVAEAMAFVFSNTCIRKKAMSSRRPPPLMQHKEIPTSLLPSRVIPDSAPPPIPMVTISQTDPVNLPTPGSSSSSAYILRWTVCL
ncbi:hypothetical protein BJV77DRAFT_1067128 [Russula vinacea]|nr:hypothetical protein BJV77DRAFT_1070206 [Russula vinacea]KAH9988901.1 hypothetical protein BJV77DRAFT_1069848 [Russula vinacea]KAH9991082.1 hypothetical protein BJV77DRAFT_1068580 [Russula vinacea]KAH9993871.1 hypothetical protein BJV77DRAFT_1067128 [Russula vinacea]